MTPREASREGTSREGTRERIVAAAVQSLVEDGYAATTTLRVQHRAGVSRGALLHHFPRREDLYVAAVHQLVADTLEEIRRALKQMPPEPDLADRTVWMIRQASISPYFAAQLELWAAARTDPSLRESLREAERPALYQLRTLMEEVFGPDIIATPHYPLFRTVVIQIMRGLAVANGLSVDHQPPESVLEQIGVLTRVVLADSVARKQKEGQCLAG